jgi:phospholipase C
MLGQRVATVALCLLVGCAASEAVTEGEHEAPAIDGGPARPETTPPVDAGAGDATVADAHDAAIAVDAAPTCPSPARVDPLRSQREACAFHAGDHASASLGLSEVERKRIPIKHVIVMMKENRSFDHVFGALKKLQPEADVADATFTNLDAKGQTVAPFHLATTCVAFDPDHQWNGMHAQANGGKMDGFVKSAAASTLSDGHFVMGYQDEKDLPFYYFLASTYALADRYFGSVRSGTFPNRDYLLMGTSDKVRSTGYLTWPDPSLPTIFDELTAAGVSWGVYADDHPLEETLNNPLKNWEKQNPWSPVSKLFTQIASDTLPSVVFVDGTINELDEHPTADVQLGEAWTKSVYDALVASKAWSSTALLFTYDESGGFADHVPPSNDVCLARPADKDFFEHGMRVPLIAVSPWARRHYVSHLTKEHTSITRFIESVFDLPAMTARDANSDALLDMFDFECTPAPIPTAPAAGTHGCGGSIWLDKASFAPGESIVVHFDGGPANGKDWIGVYPRGESPHSGSTAWKYGASDTHTAPSQGVASGTVTLDATSVNNASAWPMAAGSSWTAYFLVNDGYTSLASVPFDIHN